LIVDDNRIEGATAKVFMVDGELVCWQRFGKMERKKEKREFKKGRLERMTLAAAAAGCNHPNTGRSGLVGIYGGSRSSNELQPGVWNPDGA
jgi:hypothetical protein